MPVTAHKLQYGNLPHELRALIKVQQLRL